MDIIETPKYIIKYWIKEKKDKSPPVLRHAVFYNEEDLLKALPSIHGNYFVFEVGKPYKTKEEFDKIFNELKEDKEREEYLKLKEKFENLN